MTLFAQVVPIVPDALRIARRLAPRGGLALLQQLGAVSGWGNSYIGVEPSATCDTWLPPKSAPNDNVLDTRTSVPEWIGVVPYEAGRRLERAQWTQAERRAAPHVVAPRWFRYDAVVEVDARAGMVRVVGREAHAVARLAHAVRCDGERALRATEVREVVDVARADAHVARVRAAQELIAQGDLYQVNLAQRLEFRVSGEPLDIYAALARHTAPPFGAYIDLGGIHVCASSPELFLKTTPAGKITTAPIKGTRPRGTDALSDRHHVRELSESVKEIAELAMILDVERNDLGRVAQTGSVRLSMPPAVQTHPTLHHRVGTIVAQLRHDRDAGDLLAAAFPSGSVTGAPKVRAMEVIAELEPTRRGLYTGALGAVAHDGALTLAMAIRVLTVAQGEAHYYAGGGIVADSDPRAELEETRWKALQMTKLLGG